MTILGRGAESAASRTYARRARLLIPTALLLLVAAIWNVVRTPIERETNPLRVYDVTQLNPILVGQVIVPTTTEEIVDAVKRHDGTISIGGARHSMGGQIAAAGSVHIDMRRFDKILAYSREEKTITVQAGVRWRQILERIDPDNLSVSIMQSYANFTVGGSLSTNVHGRYVDQGPLIASVRSVKVVLADGSLVEATPSLHTDVFNGVIGGYGGLGVITEVTLALTDNVRLKREVTTVPASGYASYFSDHIQHAAGAVFHNGDLYPESYGTVHAITYRKTDDPVTIPDRLIPANASHRLDRLTYWVVSEAPLGKVFRRRVLDPVLFNGESVTWRNYQSSYDTSELEPASRATSTYALEEYFVPVDRFDQFVPQFRGILQRHDVNVVNVSIRHVLPDPGSVLAWARTEVFGFVMYYKQGTRATEQEEVGAWTRELIDAALSVGGTYYLPYQLHATETQFLRAYPRAGEFFALKARLDPTNKFRNELWNKYYHPLPIRRTSSNR
jgi:FAD/FMN-containing dehydrogenase